MRLYSKNTMKMNSLSSLAFIAVFLLLTQLAPAAFAFRLFSSGEQSSQDVRNDKTGTAGMLAFKIKKHGKNDEKKDGGGDSKDEANEDGDEKDVDKSKSEDDDEKGKSKEKDAPPPPSAAEAAYLAAVAERAEKLKQIKTPFNSASTETEDAQNNLAPLSLGNSRLKSSLASRLVPSNRVYLPPKMIIGKPSEFVVKAKAGYQVAIAMADRDSGARPIRGQNIRLGPDRKLVAAGVVADNGVATLTVDMPIQGDLIGLPVFFETAIWSKPDFSDLEIASPVKSETIEELKDKANAVIVAGDKAVKRGLRFVPDSSIPLHQRGNVNLESGRP